MSRVEAIIATTHTDKHYERFALSALEGLVDQVNSSYIPNGIEHDPRYPPFGRLVAAEIMELEDGEHAVKATIELFDESTALSMQGRTMPLDVGDVDRFAVYYDRTVAQHDAEGDIEALVRMSGAAPRPMGKKALEPLAELMLRFGEFALGGVALGVLAKVGADGWDAIKRRVADRYRLREHDELFVTAFGIAGPRPLEALVLMTNPSPADIAEYFARGLAEVDRLVGYALSREAELARVVIVWSGGEAKLAYAVRWDAIPVLVDQTLIPPLPEEWRETAD